MKGLNRIEKLRETYFNENGLNGLLLFNIANQFYFLGFPGTTALFIPPKGKSTVYVYSVNYEQAKAEGKDFNVELIQANENLTEKIGTQAKQFGIKKLAVDCIDVKSWQALLKEFPNQDILEINNLYVSELRKVKDLQEIEYMRKAGEITSEGMKVAIDAVKPGVREYEVAAEIEYAMRKRGSGHTAFESIVASGPFSAFPHGGCSDRKINEGDLVVIDIGATYNSYCSDMTRTFVAGKPSIKQQHIFDLVKSAQEKAFEATKNGALVAELDGIARQFISKAGFGENFVHRLGHGVGLEVHELPTMGPFNKDKLSVGNVVTIEPGIYLPGFGGVRLEDTVLIGEDGAEKLTTGPYSLQR